MSIASPPIIDIPILKDLSDRSLDAIRRRLIPRAFHAGQYLVYESAPAEACYFIQRGTVRACRTSLEGRMLVLARLGPGEPVNIISLLKKHKANHATVEALTEISALALTASDFFQLLETCPDFSMALLAAFANRLAGMADLAAGLSLLSVRARLARFLIHLAKAPQNAGGWTQDEIAAHIGTVRDVVGRILREWESKRMIRRDRERIILLDQENLMHDAELLAD